MEAVLLNSVTKKAYPYFRRGEPKHAQNTELAHFLDKIKANEIDIGFPVFERKY